MKTDSMNFGKMVIVALALVVAFSTTALANDGGKGDKKSELKFIGNVENQPVFELTLGSNEEDEYTVVFRDEFGNVLYSDKFTGGGVTKKFLLKSEGFAEEALNVTVRSKKGNVTEVYSISRTHSYVEETQVSKIK
ncbi:MAG TPA: hypothetical protein VM187_01165 [Niastella sp.]|nr:hypothetical protein [Niastella sp.]